MQGSAGALWDLLVSCRMRALRQYCAQRPDTKAASQVADAAFLCFGDSASGAALGILERVSYGEGRLLGTEAAPIDHR